MFEFFDDERGPALTHDESIAQQVERTAGQSRIARPSAHGFDDIERANSNSREGRFRAAGDNHVRKIVPDVTQRFADGDRAAGATI